MSEYIDITRDITRTQNDPLLTCNTDDTTNSNNIVGHDIVDMAPNTNEVTVGSVPCAGSTSNNDMHATALLESNYNNSITNNHRPLKKQRIAVVSNNKPIIIDDMDHSDGVEVIDGAASISSSPVQQYNHAHESNTIDDIIDAPAHNHSINHIVSNRNGDDDDLPNNQSSLPALEYGEPQPDDIVDLTDDLDDSVELVYSNNKHKTNFHKFTDSQLLHNKQSDPIDDIKLPIKQQVTTPQLNYKLPQHQQSGQLLHQGRSANESQPSINTNDDSAIDLTDDQLTDNLVKTYDPAVFNRTDEDDEYQRYGTVTSMIIPDPAMFGANQAQPCQPQINDEVIIILYHGNQINSSTLKAYQTFNDTARILLGQLPSNDNNVLAPYLFKQQLRIKCFISHIDYRVLGVRLQIYGTKRNRSWIERELINSTLRYASYGTGQYNGAVNNPLQNSTSNDTELLTKHIEKLFTHKLDLSVLPELPGTFNTVISTQLHSFQSDGVRWMLYREGIGLNESHHIKQPPRQQRRLQSEQVKLACGGILADEMGLGKTLQFISLIAADLLYMKSIDDTGTIHTHKPTLIICPLSVIENWNTQLIRHINDNIDLNIYIYHGANRIDDVDELMRYDIVITTYATCASDYIDPSETNEDENKQSSDDDINDGNTGNSLSVSDTNNQTSPLYLITWHRIILDEGHIIRERRTRQSRACCALHGSRRWVASGTPFQNKIDDIYSLIKFIRVDQLMSYKIFTQIILQPIKSRNPSGQDRLHKLLQNLCLRRLKTTQITDDHTGVNKDLLVLPPKSIRLRIVELDSAEKKLYDLLASTGKKQFNKMIQSGGRAEIMKNYAHILEMLLRLRQCCDHSTLVPMKYHKHGFNIDVSNNDNQQIEHRGELCDILEDSINETCMLCHTIVNEPIITNCAHIACQSCITQAMQQHSRSSLSPYPCIICHQDIRSDELITLHDLQLHKQNDEISMIQSTTKSRKARNNSSAKVTYGISSKLDVLIDELTQARQRDPTSKSVVFSQWTSFLDIIESVLHTHNIQYVRLDGTMTAQSRAKSMQSFHTDVNIQVFLISLKAGGVGLNLTAANQVIMMDIWWNPYAEDQAIDRVHRMGQSKPVDIIRLIAKDTVEQKVIELQDKKRDMVKDVLVQSNTNNNNKQYEQNMRLSDLSNLFNGTTTSNMQHSDHHNNVCTSTSSTAHSSINENKKTTAGDWYDEIL